MYIQFLLFTVICALMSLANAGIMGSSGGIAHVNWVNTQSGNVQHKGAAPPPAPAADAPAPA